MLTVKQLSEALISLQDKDPGTADLPVTFGPDMLPIAGGICRGAEGKPYLNLAPIALKEIGGF